METKTKSKKQYIGKVISNKMDKTIVVEMERMMMHSLYKKPLKQRKRVKSHDEKNECSVGDKVRIEHTRPLSRDKRYRLVEIIEKVK